MPAPDPRQAKDEYDPEMAFTHIDPMNPNEWGIFGVNVVEEMEGPRPPTDREVGWFIGELYQKEHQAVSGGCCWFTNLDDPEIVRRSTTRQTK